MVCDVFVHVFCFKHRLVTSKKSGIFRWVTAAESPGLLRGSGYLGYVDSNQGFFIPISGSKMSPNPRVINLHITLSILNL